VSEIKLIERTQIDLFAAADAPNVIDAEPIEPAPRSPFGAGRHRLGSRPGMTWAYAFVGVKPRKRRMFAPKPRLALLPGTGVSR
jgi:hypothetical protein